MIGSKRFISTDDNAPPQSKIVCQRVVVQYGMSGTAFANVEIRPNDSIYVFVETTLPSTGLIGPQDVTWHVLAMSVWLISLPADPLAKRIPSHWLDIT